MAPGYTPPRATPRVGSPVSPPPEALNLGPVEPAPWDDLNFSMPPTPPPVVEPGYGSAAPGAPAYAEAGPVAAPYGAPHPAPGYAAPPPSGGYAQAAPSAPTGWGQSGWSAPPMPNPDSLLGRTAAKTGGWGKGNDPYDTETISSAKLKGIRRRGRYGWLLAFLSCAALAGGVALGLEERQRLLNAIGHERELVTQAQSQISQAKQEAERAQTELTKAQEDFAARQTISQEDQKVMAALKAQLGEKEGDIDSAGRDIALNLLDDAMFDTGKAELSLNGYRVLARVGKVLKELPEKQIVVNAHSNEKLGKKSEFATNWEVSAARAVAVTRYLVEEVGLAPQRISASAFSQYRPRGKNAARNGRIEVVLTPAAKVDPKPAP